MGAAGGEGEGGRVRGQAEAVGVCKAGGREGEGEGKEEGRSEVVEGST